MTTPPAPGSALRPGQLPPPDRDHYLGLPDANTMGTRAARAVDALISKAIRHRAIVAIHGDVGLGKTFAAHTALRQHAPQAAIRLQFTAGANMSEIRGELWRSLGLPGEAPTNADTNRQTIRETLASHPRVLLIDEIQLLSRTALEYFRGQWDADDPGRPAIVLVGSGNTRQKILNIEALHSRILAWQQFSPLTPAEVLATVPAYHPLWKDAHPDVIMWADDNIAHGNFRNWARLTVHLRDARDHDPSLELNTDLLRWVLSQLDPTARYPTRS